MHQPFPNAMAKNNINLKIQADIAEEDSPPNMALVLLPHPYMSKSKDLLQRCMDAKRTQLIGTFKDKLPVFLFHILLIFVLCSCAGNATTKRFTLDPQVNKLLQSASLDESYPDADVIYLLDEDIVQVSNNGRCTHTVRQVFKIVSEKGKDHANCQIAYNSRTDTVSLVYARTITPEGKILALKKNATKVISPYSSFPSYSDYKKLTFSMPGASIGSVIEYKYVKNEKPVIEGQFTDNFFIQWYYPILHCRYKIITPSNMDLKYLVLNPLKESQQSPQVINSGKKKIYLWEYKDVPQILKEGYMPPIEEIAFNVSVTTIDSWEEFFRWWRKEVKGKTDSDETIKEEVAGLTKGLSSPRDKMEAIFDYVKRDIRYVSIDLGKSGLVPEPATEVFENKYGDCKDQSTLLISMLKAAGIPAHYVLIPTSGVGNLVKDFPYPFQFNHCIVAAENEGGYQYLDPVYDDHRFDYLPNSDQNRGVAIFGDHETIFETTPLVNAVENGTISQQLIEIGEDASITVEDKSLKSGSAEAFLRSILIDYSPTEMKETLERYVDSISSGARLLGYTHSDPLDFKTQLSWEIKYHADDYCKKAGDILIFEVPHIETGCSGVGKEMRRYPISYDSKSFRKEEVEFNIPEGYEVYYLPEPLKIENPYFEFRSSYKKEDAKVIYKGEIIKKAVHIPTEEYTNYKESCEIMENGCERYVLFREKR